jgi:hypothetical protein
MFFYLFPDLRDVTEYKAIHEGCCDMKFNGRSWMITTDDLKIDQVVKLKYTGEKYAWLFSGYSNEAHHSIWNFMDYLDGTPHKISALQYVVFSNDVIEGYNTVDETFVLDSSAINGDISCATLK